MAEDALQFWKENDNKFAQMVEWNRRANRMYEKATHLVTAIGEPNRNHEKIEREWCMSQLQQLAAPERDMNNNLLTVLDCHQTIMTFCQILTTTFRFPVTKRSP